MAPKNFGALSIYASCTASCAAGTEAHAVLVANLAAPTKTDGKAVGWMLAPDSSRMTPGRQPAAGARLERTSSDKDEYRSS
jgi:hypothetical protein